MSWVKAIPCDEVQNGPVIIKQAPRQLAVFNVSGDIYAIDNRCPHEGYPLSEGIVDDQCQLTCNWHNWKFRLRDGACLLGSDDVRSYPTSEAVREEATVASPPVERYLLASLNRFLHSPIKQKHIRRLARQAVALVGRDFQGT